MKTFFKYSAFIIALIILLILPVDGSAAGRYGAILCHESGYTCFKVPRGESWQSLFPNETQRGIIMRINRMGVSIYPGMIIAIPENMDDINLSDYSPFAKKITSTGEKHIIADPNTLAWGAYDENGNLVNWGPVSMGRDFCPDIGKPCHTKSGEFKVYQKGGENCISSKFPVPYGGAPMPYCMFFNSGYALHGSNEVEGYDASHGCVRMLKEDAAWLNHHFVTVGTPVTIRPYNKQADPEEDD